MEKNYVSPNKELKAFTCPHCHVYANMSYEYYVTRGDNYRGLHGDDISNEQFTIAVCEHCNNKIIWEGKKYIYPEIVAIAPNDDMPDDVKELFIESGSIYNKSPRAACALLRLAIDRLCNDLGKTDRDINKNIGDLVKVGMPIAIQKALDVVRVVGNKAVHPGTIAFDVDDKDTAIMLMRLINMIVERMISEPREIDAMYESLPTSVKESIEKRDGAK